MEQKDLEKEQAEQLSNILKCIGLDSIPEVNELYIHIKNKNIYKVVSIGKVKQDSDRTWKTSINYTNYIIADNVEPIVYTRTLESFQLHFAEVTNNEIFL